MSDSPMDPQENTEDTGHLPVAGEVALPPNVVNHDPALAGIDDAGQTEEAGIDPEDVDEPDETGIS
ncbi:MAG TPA: hypothetical protein VD735_00385 [Candidatus Saccharimonadales bacterium]|nr:hypothetical protein [Candidatus Saccharimonadales bacterium]